MKKVIFLLTISTLLFSCNDDEASKPETSEEENFYALKVGNTWTYDFFKRVDDTDEFEFDGVTSKYTIIEELEIDNENYFKFQINTEGNDNSTAFYPENGISNLIVRDSLGYLITSDSKILFSRVERNPYLIDEIGEVLKIFGELLLQNGDISVPAGNFTTLENRVFAINNDNNEEYAGTNSVNFVDGVGEVFTTCSTVSNPNHIWEKRLVSFNLVE